MKIFHRIEDFRISKKTILTIGTFDGLHFGHEKILNRLIQSAQKSGGESVVLTFHPHPRKVLFPEIELKLLSTIDEKIALFKKHNIDNLIIHPFSKSFAQLSTIDYLRNILVEKLNVGKVIVGYDHRFGKNREGTLQDLKEFGLIHQFEVEEIPAQDIDNVTVSSTKIRNALLEGAVDTANEYLGYLYSVSGRVISGNRIGRTLNFPTANLGVNEVEDKLIPADGSYAVWAHSNNTKYGGMVNIGLRPTLDQGLEKSIEVHLFNFNENIYNEQLKIEFVKRLRDVKKFDSSQALVQQLEKDKLKSLEILGFKLP